MRWPSLGCAGSRSTSIRRLRNSWEHTGPIEATTARRKPSRMCLGEALSGGHLEDVGDLGSAGEEDDVGLASGDRLDRGSASGSRSSGRVHR